MKNPRFWRGWTICSQRRNTPDWNVLTSTLLRIRVHVNIKTRSAVTDGMALKRAALADEEVLALESIVREAFDGFDGDQTAAID